MDQIVSMQAFVTVATEGSFTKAAEKLTSSSQLMSKYVSQLEEHLGARLFNRTTRKVQLTEAGEQCLQHAKQILENIRDMEGHFGHLQNKAQGMLRISAPVSFATLHLAPLIQAFKKKYPAVGIDLQLSDRKIDVIDEGFDVALRIGHLPSSSLIAKKIAPIRLVLCASPAYLKHYGVPQHPRDLRSDHYLRYSYADQQQKNSTLMEALNRKKDKDDDKFVSNNGEILLAAAIANEGYVLQPTFIAGKALKEGKLEIILPDYEPEPIALYAVYPHRKLLATKLRAFINFISDFYGHSPYWDCFD